MYVKMMRNLFKTFVQNDKVPARYLINAIPKLDFRNKNFRYNTKEGFVWKSNYMDDVNTKTTINNYVWKDLDKWKNKIALECIDTGRNYTYSQLRDYSAAFAVRLTTQYHLNKGDIIGLVMPNIPEFAIAFLGAIEANLIVTTLNPNFTSGEMSKQISSSQPKVIITISNCYDRLKNACQMNHMSPKFIISKIECNESLPNEVANFNELVNPAGVDFSILRNIELNPDNACVLPYSSGTTGLPKGVILTHENIVAGAANFNAKIPYESLTNPTTKFNQDSWLGILPFFHLSGLNVSLIPKLAAGCKMICYSKFSEENLLKGLNLYKPPVLMTVPPIFSCLAQSSNITEKHLSSVRSVVCGAAPLGESVVRRFLTKKENVEILQVYGMTETSGVTMMSQKNGSNLSTVGWPSANTEAKIINSDDPLCRGLNANELGEILVRGPNVTKAYYKNEEATKAAITSDGWIHTGDLGYYDVNGFFYVKDRLKELIKVNGYQVAPAELEDILRSHPMVADVGVSGVPDEKKGEAPRAYVVQKPNTKLSEKDLHDFVANQVIEYKRLHGGIKFVKSIPKNATGKILRRHLRQLD